MLSLEKCYDDCRRIALGHYENFPVGSLLLPKPLRKHLYALYAFMRTADDIADDHSKPSDEKLAQLHSVRRALNEGSTDPMIMAVRNTLRVQNLDSSELHLLLDAFEFDAQGNVQFQTIEKLRWYTARSAEPVGRLVLALFGYRDARLIEMSNEVTSALQLLNFIQDAKDDLASGRCYFPREDHLRYGISDPVEIQNEAGAQLLAFEAHRVLEMLESGRELPERVTGRLRFELRAVLLSARRLLKKMEQEGWSHLSKHSKPQLGKAEQLYILFRSLLGPVPVASHWRKQP